ncbi:MAG: hypothetical protein L6R38_007651 [Xanthoria sp. 2 TBL-2021]|nr:MAG: hypothetical protein L6R38_007651 [Xanthoria sp. 2 TBL-2021]
MTTSNTPRRILQDLPVNAFGTPGASNLPTSSTSSLKRQIHEVEDPNLPPSPLRSRLSDHTPSLGLKPTRETGPETASHTALRTKPHEDGDEMVEGSTQDSSKGTRSESVYSDMEGDTIDTQQTAATETSLPTGLSTLSRAETLRLRLRVALFKVQTDQTNIPVSQLRLPKSCLPELNSSAHPSSRRANVQPPRLLPAPILKPTVRPNGLPQFSQILSSPPVTRAGSPAKASDGDIFRTPSLPQSKVQVSQQLSSPPNSQNGDLKETDMEDSHLSSSAVKGDAAISLLGLRDDRR